VLPISRPDADREIRGRLSWQDWRPTIVAAVLTLLGLVVLATAFASVAPSERRVALASLSTTIFWMSAAMIGACGTIAALMLTTVSLMEHLDTRRMGPRFLMHMRLTVLGAVATIAVAVGDLLLTIFPFASGVEVDPPRWQIDSVYFGLLGGTALMIGGFAVVLSSLYATIADVFRNLPDTWIDEILAEDEEQDREEEAARRHVGVAPRRVAR